MTNVSDIVADFIKQHPADCRCSEFCRVFADADWGSLFDRPALSGLTAQSPGPELTEDAIEHACLGIIMARIGAGMAHFRHQSLLLHQRLHPRMRKEFAQLFEGDKLIGQLVIERPFDARDWLPYVERVHPDDMKLGNAPVPGDSIVMIGEGFVRKQRFNLHKGRYVLEGTET